MNIPANHKCTNRLAFPLRSEQSLADSYAMPIATFSPCSSEESPPCVSEEVYASAESLPAATKSISGETFSSIQDRYWIAPRTIGRGHQGTVRECIDRRTGRQYAVKTIQKSNPAVKPAGLAREISLLREMKHPNIIQLNDVYEDEKYVHLVTDLCAGELFNKIKEKTSARNKRVPCFEEDDAARIIRQVLSAVAFMQSKNTVHRDIKPENILYVSNADRSPVKIIDFGLARRHFDNLGEPPMSAVVGTPYYIAPEVLRKKYDKSCDLWSVGITTYILLCGYPPFNGANHEETHKLILAGRYSFDPEEWKFHSPEAQDFVRRLLQVDPRKRMTVAQALNHPWIVRHADNNAPPISEAPEGLIMKVGLSGRGSMLSGRSMRRAMFGV